MNLGECEGFTWPLQPSSWKVTRDRYVTRQSRLEVVYRELEGPRRPQVSYNHFEYHERVPFTLGDRVYLRPRPFLGWYEVPPP